MWTGSMMRVAHEEKPQITLGAGRHTHSDLRHYSLTTSCREGASGCRVRQTGYASRAPFSTLGLAQASNRVTTSLNRSTGANTQWS